VIDEVNHGKEQRESNGDTEDGIDGNLGHGWQAHEPITLQREAQQTTREDNQSKRSQDERFGVGSTHHAVQDDTSDQDEQHAKVLECVRIRSNGARHECFPIKRMEYTSEIDLD